MYSNFEYCLSQMIIYVIGKLRICSRRRMVGSSAFDKIVFIPDAADKERFSYLY